jgi:hypothetical protein
MFVRREEVLNLVNEEVNVVKREGDLVSLNER